MPPIVAAALVFATSAAILVLEILAARLLAPFVGVTLETYTAIIGTVLAGISVGTWLGGRAADRYDARRLLGPLLIGGGVLALLVVPLVTFAFGLGLAADPAGVVTYSALAFFAPSAVLSAVTPTVVKLQLRDLGETGSVVGRLSAIATAGAIVGTFVTGFVLVSAAPSRSIVLALGAALVVSGLVVSATIGRTRVGGVVAAVLVTALGAGTWTTASPQPCERESAYFCVRVESDTARPSGRTIYLDTLRHSYVDLDDPTHLEFSYAQTVTDVVDATAPAGAPLRVLTIGGGGFTLPRYIAATRPGSASRVLELDPVVVATAREELGLVTSDALSVRVGDARVGIRDEPSGAYDIVIGDAFSGLAVPWHLATREMVAEIGRVLTPTGLYVVNVIDYPPLAFARAEVATLLDVFPHVAVIAREERLGRRAGGNIILVGSYAPIPTAAIVAGITARNGGEGVVSDTESTVQDLTLSGFIGDAQVLTDDFAPVDQLLSFPQ